jgi:hypothetical protein
MEHSAFTLLARAHGLAIVAGALGRFWDSFDPRIR